MNNGFRSRLCFIIGAGRSGTTWLLRSLATHPDVLGIPETHMFELRQAPGPDAHSVLSRATWRIVRDGIRLSDGTGVVSEEQLEDTSPLARQFLTAVTPQALCSLFRRQNELDRYRSWDEFGEAVLRDLDGIRPVLIEKTPRHALSCERIKARVPEGKFIGLIRDGRDVLASLRALGKDWTQRLHEVQEAASHWARCNMGILEAKNRWPEDVYLLRYEDLLADFDGRIREVLKFVGLSENPALLRRIHEQNTFEAYTGRQSGDDVRGAFCRRGIAGGFINDLTEADVAEYERLVGPLLETLGYGLLTRRSSDARAETPAAAKIHPTAKS